jgi:hypothetical protein
MSLSDKQKNAMLDTLDGRFVSLHTGDPGTTGAHEVSGGSYMRMPENLDASSGGSKTNSAALEFAGMPAGTVTHVGFWSLGSGGVFLWGGALSAPVVVPAGATFRFPAGQLTLTQS